MTAGATVLTRGSIHGTLQQHCGDYIYKDDPLFTPTACTQKKTRSFTLMITA